MKPRSAPLPSSPEGRDASATVSLCVCTSRDFESSCTTVTPKGRRSGSLRSSMLLALDPLCCARGTSVSAALFSIAARTSSTALFVPLVGAMCVNNASAYYPTPLLPGDDTNGAAEAKPIDAQVAELFSSNAVAPLFLIRAFARRQGEGGAWRSRNLSVVNLCDAMTDLPLPGFCVYTMAKHVLGGLTRAAALELAPRHIRVNAVAPGLSLLPRNAAGDAGGVSA
ncbi:pteridine reductase [Trypanosoma cruzi]|nr:pteridine reductase [Trypanosoma cruzi]